MNKEEYRSHQCPICREYHTGRYQVCEECQEDMEDNEDYYNYEEDDYQYNRRHDGRWR